jgi:hypothetical protein
MKEQVAIKKVIFNNASPDFIYSVEAWVNGGNFTGFLKENCISIRDVDHVENGTMDYDKFHYLPAWEG